MNQFTVPWRPETETAEIHATGERIGPVAEYTASDEDIDAYQRDGVLFIKGVFADWVDFLLEGLERNLANPKAHAFPCESTEEGEPGRFLDSYCNWLRIPEYKRYVYNSCTASMAGQFMRSKAAQFFHEHAFVKEPGTRRSVI